MIDNDVIDLEYLGSMNVKEMNPKDLKTKETKTEILTESDKVCLSQNGLNSDDFYQQPSPSLIPLPKLMRELNIIDFNLIWKLLNSDSQFNWEWFAGKVGLKQIDVSLIKGSSGNPSERFLTEWSSKGATTSRLLALLAGKRVDIIQELAKSYIIP